MLLRKMFSGHKSSTELCVCPDGKKLGLNVMSEGVLFSNEDV